MLGLKYGTVQLVEHDPRWLEAFEEERAALAAVLDGLGCAIEHIGNTTGGRPRSPA